MVLLPDFREHGLEFSAHALVALERLAARNLPSWRFMAATRASKTQVTLFHVQ